MRGRFDVVRETQRAVKSASPDRSWLLQQPKNGQFLEIIKVFEWAGSGGKSMVRGKPASTEVAQTQCATDGLRGC